MQLEAVVRSVGLGEAEPPVVKEASAVVELLWTMAPRSRRRPIAALATVVFLIGIELIDVAGMRRIYLLRREEFLIAALTAAAVVVLGVEQGVLLAIVASMVDHLRHSYHPPQQRAGEISRRALAITTGDCRCSHHPGAGHLSFRHQPVFRQRSQLAADITTLTHQGNPPRWLCLDGAAIGDVDYTAAAVLLQITSNNRPMAHGWCCPTSSNRSGPNWTATGSPSPWDQMPTSPPPARPSKPSTATPATALMPVISHPPKKFEGDPTRCPLPCAHTASRGAPS